MVAEGCHFDYLPIFGMVVIYDFSTSIFYDFFSFIFWFLLYSIVFYFFNCDVIITHHMLSVARGYYGLKTFTYIH